MAITRGQEVPPTSARHRQSHSSGAASVRTRSSSRCRTERPSTSGTSRQFPSGRSRARFGADPDRGIRRRVGRRRRLQAGGGSHVRGVRAGPLRYLHHRIDLRPADLPLGRDRRSSWRDILAWWNGNREADRTSVIFCYTIGKAQRLLAELARVTDTPVYVHGMMLGHDRRLSGSGRRSPGRPPGHRTRRRPDVQERCRSPGTRARAALRARHAMDAAARHASPTRSRRA